MIKLDLCVDGTTRYRERIEGKNVELFLARIGIMDGRFPKQKLDGSLSEKKDRERVRRRKEREMVGNALSIIFLRLLYNSGDGSFARNGKDKKQMYIFFFSSNLYSRAIHVTSATSSHYLSYIYIRNVGRAKISQAKRKKGLSQQISKSKEKQARNRKAAEAQLTRNEGYIRDRGFPAYIHQ